MNRSMKVRIAICAVFAILSFVTIVTAPPASASQLAPGVAVWKTPGSCSSWSVYQGLPLQGILRAQQDTGPSWSSCGGAQAYITLVFFDPVFGLLNVICQHGSNANPSLSGIGRCFWDGWTLTQTAIWPNGTNTAQVAFGMKVDFAAIVNGQQRFYHDEYSAFG